MLRQPMSRGNTVFQIHPMTKNEATAITDAVPRWAATNIPTESNS